MRLFIRYSRPTSHLYAVLFPERAGWDLHAILTGKAVDYLGLLVWSKTKGARRGWGRPPSVLPFGKSSARPGAKVAAAPLSVVKERLRRLHRKVRPRALPPANRGQQIHDIFKE